jgi:bacillithiol synthase
MRISKIGFEKINALAHKDVFYQLQNHKLADFISYTPDDEGLSQAILDRSKYQVNRTLIHEVISDQYRNKKASAEQSSNIEALLSENTFTVITAHQPIILGGPAYYFYKICSTINLCHHLAEKNPDKTFVPVFINGSEDHDFDEVNKLQLFGKSLSWETEQHGPVGKFGTENLDKLIHEVSDILGDNENSHNLIQTFTKALNEAKDYNEFVFSWLDEIYAKYGLLVINMDDIRLKKNAIPILKKELQERKSESIVHDTQNELHKFNFKPQAFARDINLFYMSAQSRERITYEEGMFAIHNTTITFTEAEMMAEVEKHPERFSPNVVLRPIYQEFTLPNIAYIGGGGEIAYWLERKSQFKYFGVFYPTLIRRNSVMLISKSIQKSMAKLGMTEEELLLDEDAAVSQYLKKTSTTDFELDKETVKIAEIYHEIAEKAKSIDPTLEHFVIGEATKIIKATEAIESRLKRSLKHKEEVSVNQIKNIKSKLFPDHGLQERKESLLQYLVSEDKDFLEKLIDNLNPLEKEFLFVYL